MWTATIVNQHLVSKTVLRIFRTRSPSHFFYCLFSQNNAQYCKHDMLRAIILKIKQKNENSPALICQSKLLFARFRRFGVLIKNSAQFPAKTLGRGDSIPRRLRVPLHRVLWRPVDVDHQTNLTVRFVWWSTSTVRYETLSNRTIGLKRFKPKHPIFSDWDQFVDGHHSF